MIDKSARIYIADAQPLVETALRIEFQRLGYVNVVPKTSSPRLTDFAAFDEFFSRSRPDYVFLIGASTGGIRANQDYPADLMRDNLLVNCQVIDNAHRHGVRKLLYLASSCVYPKFSEQPMKIEHLTTGKLEPTNEPYAIAKLAGLFLCQAYRRQFGNHFISGIPANVFGPADDFSLENSHVIGALIRKMHDAKAFDHPRVELWGSGSPRREFIFSHDLADACIFLMEHYDGHDPVNIGVGSDWSIREIGEMIREIVGYTGELSFDTSKPDGMPAKLLDSNLLARMGWRPRTPIREALASTYEWFLRNEAHLKGIENARTVL